MSDVPPPEPEPQRESIMQTLQGRIAGIPVVAVVIVLVLLALFYFARRRTQQQQQTQQQTTAASATTQGVSSQVGTSQVPVLVTGTPVIPTSNINAQPQNVPLMVNDMQSGTLAPGNNFTSPTMGSAQQVSAGTLNPGNESGQPAAGTATQMTTPSTAPPGG